MRGIGLYTPHAVRFRLVWHSQPDPFVVALPIEEIDVVRRCLCINNTIVCVCIAPAVATNYPGGVFCLFGVFFGALC